MASTKVQAGTVLKRDATNVGEVYFKLAKYMLRVKVLFFHQGGKIRRKIECFYIYDSKSLKSN